MAKEPAVKAASDPEIEVKGDTVDTSGAQPHHTPGAAANRGAVKAVCPRNEQHPGAVVDRTVGKVRFCKCNTCGETWKQSGPYYDPLREYVSDFADRLDEQATKPVEVAGKQAVLVSVADVRKLTKKLRELVNA